MATCLVVPRVKVNVGRTGQHCDGLAKLFNVKQNPSIFQWMSIHTHGREDDAVIPILVWNYKVSLRVCAPSGLE